MTQLLRRHLTPHGCPTRERRQHGAVLAEANPRVGMWRREPRSERAQRELIGTQLVGQLVPENRSCDRRTWPGARRVRADCSRAAAIAQIVDQRLALALCLRNVGHVLVRLVTDHRIGHCAAESLGFIPRRLGLDRYDQVQSLAARRLQEDLEL